MQLTALEKTILASAYAAYFLHRRGIHLHQVRDAGGFEPQIFEQSVAHLVTVGLLRPWAAGWYNRITPKGILFAEDSNLGEDQAISTHRRARTILLDYLAQQAEESVKRSGTFYRQIIIDTGLEEAVVRSNLMLLKDLSYVDTSGGGIFKITNTGISAVQQWRERKEIGARFEALTQMKPQPRGRALQQLLAHVLAYSGWHQEEGVRTSNEELDIIVHKASTAPRKYTYGILTSLMTIVHTHTHVRCPCLVHNPPP